MSIIVRHNLPQFEASLDALASRTIPNIYVRLMRALTLDIYGRLIILTPVDTGFARRSWTASIGSPSSFVPTPGLERYDAPSAAEAMAALSTLRFGDSAYITSNAVYIERLNDGWSKQAPAQFIELAIEQGLSALGRAA